MLPPKTLLSRAVCCIAVSFFGHTASAQPASETYAKPPLAWASIAIHVSNPTARITDSDDDPGGASNDRANGTSEHNMSLREIISEGYNFSVFPFRAGEISGLPAWARTQRYDIEARVDDADVDAFKKLSNLSIQDTLAAFVARRPTGEMLMMQALLRDRFHLKVHWEMKERSSFNLVTAKGGLRLKPSSTDIEHSEMNFSPGHISGKGVPFSFLASVLAMPLGHTVVDATGDPRSYDFDLHFTPLNTPASTTSNDPDIFTAVQEQIGLKLQSTHAPVPILVIDHVEPPTPN
ncbi:MAG TPA: TIGR03435 family protein [Acidobacteriaceae bacterium]|nr:TIGR03435 family protein [Acidobacteriaceae bacterium]